MLHPLKRCKMCNLFIKEFLYTAVTLQEPIELECMLYSCLVSKLVLNLRNKLIKGYIRYIYIYMAVYGADTATVLLRNVRVMGL